MSFVILIFVAYFAWLALQAVHAGIRRWRLDRAIERLPLVEDSDERRFLERERRRRANEKLGKRYGLDE